MASENQNYFITLNIESKKDYKQLIKVLESNYFNVLGVDSVTRIEDIKDIAKVKEAMEKHVNRINSSALMKGRISFE